MFQDRFQAGQVLAESLRHYRGRDDVLLLGLPRGGVVVAYEVGRILGLPMDTFLVRKLGVPGHEELAMGAIASGGIRVLNHDLVRALAIPQQAIEDVVERESRELARRDQAYRPGKPPIDIRGKTVILVDDGLATGASMRAAIAALRSEGAARIVVAVPTAPADTCDEMQAEVDEMVCATTPEPFYGVGMWYRDFSEVPDQQVQELLGRADREYEQRKAALSQEHTLGHA